MAAIEAREPAEEKRENVAVYVRVRAHEGRKALTANPALGELVLHTPASSEDRSFTFDFVGGEETAQE